MEKLKKIELIIEDDDANIVGDLSAVSIVADPAVEVPAFFFSSQEEDFNFAVADEEKQLITSVAMIPDIEIPRINPETGEKFNVWFSKETILKCSQIFAKNGGYGYSTIQHTPEKIRDIFVTESWIVGENDKAYALGFSKEDVPVGSWMLTFKVDNKDIWEKLKYMKKLYPGLGFSIESRFSMRETFSAIDNIIEDVITNEPGKEPEVNEEVIQEEKPQSKKESLFIYDTVKDVLFDEELTDEEKYKMIKKIIKKN